MTWDSRPSKIEIVPGLETGALAGGLWLRQRTRHIKKCYFTRIDAITLHAAPVVNETAASPSQAETGSATETVAAVSAPVPVPETGATNNEEDATSSVTVEDKMQSSHVDKKMVDDSTATKTDNTETIVDV